MKRQAIVLLGMLVFPALGGCEGDGPTPPKPEVPPDVERDTTAPIQTDTTFYTLREDWVGLETEIALRFENQTGDTLYIVSCRGAPALEKRIDGAWENFWSPICLAWPRPEIVIDPTSVFVDTLHLWGALPGQNFAPRFKSDDVEGIYRIVMHSVVFHYDEDRRGFGDPVPLEYRISNLFALDDPRR